jgi:condensin complex subunit 2
MDIVEPPQEEVDFFTGDQAVGDDFGGGFGAADEMGMDEPTEIGSPPPDEENRSHGDSGTTEPFNPRRVPNEKDLVMAMTEEDGSGMMDYFDQTFLKNWAGPEHWKLRKVVRKGSSMTILVVTFGSAIIRYS